MYAVGASRLITDKVDRAYNDDRVAIWCVISDSMF